MSEANVSSETVMGAMTWSDFLAAYRLQGTTVRQMEILLGKSGILPGELVKKTVHLFKQHMDAGVGPDATVTYEWIQYSHLHAIACLLTDPILGLLHKPLSAMPTIEDIRAIISKRESMKVPYRQLLSFPFPSWDGRTCTWSLFEMEITMLMWNLGLGSLVRFKDKDLDDEDELEIDNDRLSDAALDTMFFRGLCASMYKTSMKLPRVEYVNMVYWGDAPYRGSNLWSFLKHSFRSKLLEKNREAL